MEEKFKMIDDIKTIKKQIQNIWKEIHQDDINHLREIWNDNTCEVFVEKINNLNHTIDDIISQLNMLESFWNQYNSSNNHV